MSPLCLQVEEHQLIQASGSGPSASATASASPATRLASERRVSRHAVAEICCLPAACCLAARSEDGSAHLAGYETATVYPLPGIRR